MMLNKLRSWTDSPHKLFLALFDTVHPEDGHSRQLKHVGVDNKQSQVPLLVFFFIKFAFMHGMEHIKICT
jgi:hypothetical protein